MKIEKLNPGVQITETASLLQAIVKSSKGYSFGGDTYLTQMLKQLSELSGSMSAAINKSTVLSELEAKDELCDNTLRALFYLHSAMSIRVLPI